MVENTICVPVSFWVKIKKIYHGFKCEYVYKVGK